MSETQRAFVEEVIRSGKRSGEEESDEGGEAAQPTIALKMDFGG